ncbi:MAG TPA: PBP1A family penicillin-binding protein [Ignavibacteria bacterium]|nr:PBP1A family penicillin-binding protein [Ignavibacteria bacterium]
MSDKNKYNDEELDKYFSDKNFRQKKLKKNKTQNKLIGSVLITALIILIIAASYLYYLSSSLPSLAELENPKLEEATKIYSSDGELIDKFFLKNRTKVTLDNIPKQMIQALIATEDQKFYDHWGVDIDRIFKAIFKNVTNGSLTKEGASTITQQLARNMYKDIGTEVSLNRKLREAMTAVQIERTYTKEEILAYYLNTVYFGKGAYGVEAAAQTYFDKSSKDLTIDECAVLVGTLKSPSNYDPVDNPEASVKRRNLVLNEMYQENFITKENLDIAINDPLKVNLKKDYANFNSPAPQFTEYIRQLMEKKAEKFGYDLYRDGLKVYTSLDSRFQKHAVDAVKSLMGPFQKSFNGYWNWNSNKSILNDAIDKTIKQSENYKKANTEQERNKIYDKLKNDKSFIDSVKILTSTVQVGFVVINPKTGEIKAMVGANPNTTFKYGLNHVTQIKRQPGSSFKPFVYATAVNNGYSPGYMVSNEAININIGGTMWSPKGGGTGGRMTMRDGLANSVNVVAVRTAMDLAPMDQVITLAHNMGVNEELPNVLSLALGVGEVTPLEMTNAFGTFANEGIWVEPVPIIKIEDRNGTIIEEIHPESKEVLSEETAYIVSDMLEGVIDYGTARSIRQYFHRPAAGKTGTSQSYTDAWFVGYTPQFSAGVWLGFDDARIKFGGAYGQGGRAAAPIWGKFMELLYSDEEFNFPVEYFLMPEGVEETNVCTISGLKSNGTCPSTTDLVIKKFNQKKCNVFHYSTPDETSVEATEPPKGSVGY